MIRTRLVRIIQQGINSGVFRNVDPEPVAGLSKCRRRRPRPTALLGLRPALLLEEGVFSAVINQRTP